jgi:TonB-linked SusC/RagA family outer membrane protein
MNKNNCTGNILTEKIPYKHFLLIMRTTLILLSTCIFCSIADMSYTQDALVTINKQQCTIKEVLNEIEKQTDYLFIYSNEVNTNEEISISVNQKEVSEVLNSILYEKEMKYSIVGNHLLLSKKRNEIVNTPDISSLIKQQTYKRITGRVIDESGMPIIGANIIEVGTTNGTVTDIDGNYSLQIADGSSIHISYIGYLEQTISTTGETFIETVLVEDMQSLDEVVVVGYGTQKKITVTGAVSSLESSEIIKAPSANVANALSGRLPGVAFIQQSGEPGADDPIIRVRGVSSLGDPLGAANDPLVLVDGIERNFSRIDPEEIESISVLKDASSTAVYGVRGANGVIIITTKRGASGKPSLNYSAQLGLQQPSVNLEYSDAYQYATLINEGQANDGISPENRDYTPEEIEIYRTNSQPYLYPSMVWTDYLVKEVAPQHKHNVNIQGGTENLRYFVSLGYLNQAGIYKNFTIGDGKYDPTFSYERYNFRSNFDFDITKSTTLKITTGGNLGNRHGPAHNTGLGNGNFWFELQQANPMKFVGIIDGKKVESEDRRGRSGPADALYFSGFSDEYISDFNFDATINQSLDKITKGLRVHATIAYDSRYTHTKRREKSYATYITREDENSPDGYTIVKRGQDWGMGFSESYWKYKKLYSEFGINYERSINNHNFTALALYNQQKRWYPSLAQSDIPTAYLGLVGRITYDYAMKYLFDFNLGYNGSENFAPGKRFGLFPAVSAGWIISEESFFKDNISFIDYLKLRFSFGVVGKDNLGWNRFYYLPDRYSFTGGYFFGNSRSISPGAREASLGNPDVTWEKSKKQNYAIELRSFNQMLGITFEYFTENRTDILITRRSVPTFVAATLPPVNLGKVKNNGYEVQLNWNHPINKDLRYSIGVNFLNARNKIIFNDEPLGNYEHQWETGKPIGQNFGYEFIGFFKDQNDIDNSPLYYEGTKPGDVKYKDINGDGVINSADITAIGYPQYPEITYGINGGVYYKNFDLMFLLQGATNVSIALSDEFIIPYLNEGPVMKYIWNERWTPETAETATYPRMIASPTRDHNNYMPSSLWTRDASYIRLKNIDLGYTIRNKEYLSRLGINKVRLGLNGVNLLTFTPLTVGDPEAASGRVQFYPTMKVYNFNLNVEF